jgi:hypothetical protein
MAAESKRPIDALSRAAEAHRTSLLREWFGFIANTRKWWLFPISVLLARGHSTRAFCLYTVLTSLRGGLKPEVNEVRARTNGCSRAPCEPSQSTVT